MISTCLISGSCHRIALRLARVCRRSQARRGSVYSNRIRVAFFRVLWNKAFRVTFGQAELTPYIIRVSTLPFQQCMGEYIYRERDLRTENPYDWSMS